MSTRGEHLVRADRRFATGGGIARAARRAGLFAGCSTRSTARLDERRARRHRCPTAASAGSASARPAPSAAVRSAQLDGAGSAGDLGLGRLVQGVDAGRMVEPRSGRDLRAVLGQRRAARRRRPRQGPVPAGSMRSPTACATMRRARRGENIAAHYDLGNDFYSAWLDETMTYSSRALRRARRQPRRRPAAQGPRPCSTGSTLKPGQRLLEIGCGWGSLAIEAAKRGASVVGLTLSNEQKAWAEREDRRRRPVRPDRNPPPGLSRHRRAVRRRRLGRDGRGGRPALVGAPISTASPAT